MGVVRGGRRRRRGDHNFVRDVGGGGAGRKASAGPARVDCGHERLLTPEAAQSARALARFFVLGGGRTYARFSITDQTSPQRTH